MERISRAASAERNQLVLERMRKGIGAKAIAAELSLPTKTIWQITSRLRKKARADGAKPTRVLYNGEVKRPMLSASVEQVQTVRCPHCRTVIVLNP